MYNVIWQDPVKICKMQWKLKSKSTVEEIRIVLVGEAVGLAPLKKSQNSDMPSKLGKGGNSEQGNDLKLDEGH
jgi:hypothetical protein